MHTAGYGARRKVFIVHGHDSSLRVELSSFLRYLGLESVVLVEEDDLGFSIIEKFEHYAATCEFALVLMTPDDRQASDLRGQEKWRARQNVILELGWFMARLGRSRVVVVHKGEVEIPSDVLGVLYLRFANSVFEVSDQIRGRLAGQGLL